MPSTRRNRTSGVVFDTGLVGVLSDDPTNDVVNPVTPTMRAIDLKDLMIDVWIGHLVGCNDGVDTKSLSSIHCYKFTKNTVHKVHYMKLV